MFEQLPLILQVSLEKRRKKKTQIRFFLFLSEISSPDKLNGGS